MLVVQRGKKNRLHSQYARLLTIQKKICTDGTRALNHEMRNGFATSFLQLFSLFKFWMLCAPSFSNRIYAYGWWTNGNGWAACVQHANQNHCIEAHRQQLMAVSHTLCWFIFQLNFSGARSDARTLDTKWHKRRLKIPHNCACARAPRARVLWDAQRPV